MSELTPTERLLRRDRSIIVTALTAIAVLAWLHLLSGAGTGMSPVAMTTWQFPPAVHASSPAAPWDATYWAVMGLMWWVMMIAMMVPSAAPMILLYARVQRHAEAKGRAEQGVLPTAAFAAGYLVAWLAFSIAATAAQWTLERAGLVHAVLMWSTSTGLSAAFLFAAGAYQLSPLKHVCLRHCRSPAEFLSRHWRKGRLGALGMGLAHGAYCVGCCWFLMALLFVGGAMNLVWIAGLAMFVLIEKLVPRGDLFARAAGLAFILAGFYALA